MIEGAITRTGVHGLGGELPGELHYGLQGPPGKDGGYYTPAVTQLDEDTIQFDFTPSKPDMPTVAPVTVELPAGQGSGGNVDLTGYATEQFVRDGYQPKGEYLSAVPEGYAKTEDIPKNPADIGAQPEGNYALRSEIPSVPVKSVNGKTGAVSLTATDVKARPDSWMPTAADVKARPDNWMPSAQEVGALPDTYTPPNQTAEQVGADPKGTAATAVSQHNTADDSHNDIRLELKAINDRLTAFFDSDNQTLDELSEIVAYITSNKTLIDSITTSKVSVADIIDNLTTNVSNKPLSAAQGVVLKGLIDTVSNSLVSYALKIEIPTKVSQLTNDKGYLTEHQDISGKMNASELPMAINTALAQAKESGEFDGEDGEDGYTPVRGVDYYTDSDKAEYSEYIASELAKRGQLTPEYADSIEECTDTTKLYVLPDGMIYAYALTEVTEGGYTNLADPASTEWLTKQRYNASHALTSASESNAFVSNVIPCKPEDIIRIKNVQDSSGTSSTKAWFRIAGCKNDGTLVNGKAYYPTRDYSAVSGTSCYGAVTVSGDGIYSYPVLHIHYSENSVKQAVTGDAVSTFAGVRIAGCYVGSAENVIITVNEEIIEPTTTTGYQWVNTGHAFVPADYEDRVIALEKDAERLDRKIDAEVSKLQNQIDSALETATSGAKWFGLGDSITHGYVGYIKDDGTAGSKLDTASSWATLVAKKNGYELTNYGVGGTGYVYGNNNARALVDTIDFSQCDFVTLAYGVNDWKYSAAIGSMDDDIDTGGTMVSNMRYVIKKIMQDNPLCKIFVITPINCKPSSNFTYATNWGIDSGSKGLLNGYGLSEIFELMQEVCRYHGVEMIDMTYNSCVNRENLETILPDGVHPSVEGHKLMARELAQKIMFR